MTRYLNHAYNLAFAALALMAALPTEILAVIPERYKPYVIAASALALWLKSHRNLFVNPDGSAAQSAWEPPKKQP